MVRDSLESDDAALLAWETLARRYVYRSRWLTARRDHVRLPGGHELEDYYVLEYPDWAQALLLTPDDEVVLVEIYRHGLGKVHLELPGGCVEGGESPEHAARREAREETGYEARVWSSLGWVCANPATHDNRSHMFLGTGAFLAGCARPEAGEQLRTRLTPLAQIPDLLEAGAVVQASHAYALATLLRARGV